MAATGFCAACDEKMRTALRLITESMACCRRSDSLPDEATFTPEDPITPEDTLREAGISSKRQAKYQRRMSSLLAGRPR